MFSVCFVSYFLVSEVDVPLESVVSSFSRIICYSCSLLKQLELLEHFYVDSTVKQKVQRFPIHSCPLCTCRASPIIGSLHQSGTLVTVDESWGAWLALSPEHVTLFLKVVSLTPHIGCRACLKDK